MTCHVLFAVYSLYFPTKDPVYLQIYRFWKRIFAVGFTVAATYIGQFLLLLAPAFFQPFRDYVAAYHDNEDAKVLTVLRRHDCGGREHPSGLGAARINFLRRVGCPPSRARGYAGSRLPFRRYLVF